MIFENCKTRIDKKPYIMIDSLEQLMKLIKDTKNELVVSEDTITIYDGYLE